MITEKDESHYHEMIAHVPLAYADQAERVLIIGGGDGGTLGQVLKHTNIKEVTIIELDPAVVRTSREYFPKIASSFDDARVTLLHENGAKYVSEYVGLEYDNDLLLDKAVDSILGDGDERIRATRRPTTLHKKEKEGKKKKKSSNKSGSKSRSNSGGPLPGGDYYDVVLVDSTDFGVATPLFTRSFYENVNLLLRPGMLDIFTVTGTNISFFPHTSKYSLYGFFFSTA
jgi:spermidine synthase